MVLTDLRKNEAATILGFTQSHDGGEPSSQLVARLQAIGLSLCLWGSAPCPGIHGWSLMSTLGYSHITTTQRYPHLSIVRIVNDRL
jgi:hypothetical protein